MIIRFSTMLRVLNRDGEKDLARKLEVERQAIGACAIHGELTDPVIGILDDRIVYACPWCSGEAVRDTWEREGTASLVNDAITCDLCDAPARRILTTGSAQSRRFTCDEHREHALSQPGAPKNDAFRVGTYDDAFAELQQRNGT